MRLRSARTNLGWTRGLAIFGWGAGVTGGAYLSGAAASGSLGWGNAAGAAGLAVNLGKTAYSAIKGTLPGIGHGSASYTAAAPTDERQGDDGRDACAGDTVLGRWRHSAGVAM